MELCIETYPPRSHVVFSPSITLQLRPHEPLFYHQRYLSDEFSQYRRAAQLAQQERQRYILQQRQHDLYHLALQEEYARRRRLEQQKQQEEEERLYWLARQYQKELARRQQLEQIAQQKLLARQKREQERQRQRERELQRQLQLQRQQQEAKEQQAHSQSSLDLFTLLDHLMSELVGEIHCENPQPVAEPESRSVQTESPMDTPSAEASNDQDKDQGADEVLKTEEIQKADKDHQEIGKDRQVVETQSSDEDENAEEDQGVAEDKPVDERLDIQDDQDPATAENPESADMPMEDRDNQDQSDEQTPDKDIELNGEMNSEPVGDHGNQSREATEDMMPTDTLLGDTQNHVQESTPIPSTSSTPSEESAFALEEDAVDFEMQESCTDSEASAVQNLDSDWETLSAASSTRTPSDDAKVAKEMQLQLIQEHLVNLDTKYDEAVSHTTLEFDGSDVVTAITPDNRQFLGLEDEVVKTLIQLDSIDSDGDEDIRHERKALVKQAEALLSKLDAHKQQEWERVSVTAHES